MGSRRFDDDLAGPIRVHVDPGGAVRRVDETIDVAAQGKKYDKILELNAPTAVAAVAAVATGLDDVAETPPP